MQTPNEIENFDPFNRLWQPATFLGDSSVVVVVEPRFRKFRNDTKGRKMFRLLNETAIAGRFVKFETSPSDGKARSNIIDIDTVPI